MAATGVSHIGIGVIDMDRSLRFYRDVLGLRVAADHIQDVGGAPSLLTGTKPTQRRGVYLRWDENPDSPFIDLSCHEGAEPGPQLKIDEVGVHHIAIWVNNLEEIHERLKAAGATILTGPHVGDSSGHGEPPGGKILTMIFLDPDGTMLQLDQRVG